MKYRDVEERDGGDPDGKKEGKAVLDIRSIRKHTAIIAVVCR
jgi:hypothetical protein